MTEQRTVSCSVELPELQGPLIYNHTTGPKKALTHSLQNYNFMGADPSKLSARLSLWQASECRLWRVKLDETNATYGG